VEAKSMIFIGDIAQKKMRYYIFVTKFFVNFF